jgi:hypothetical protein
MDLDSSINRLIEESIVNNTIRFYRDTINTVRNRNLSRLISNRYYNNPPLGGYFINEDDEYVFSDSDLLILDNDDLSSVVFLDTINNIGSIESINNDTLETNCIIKETIKKLGKYKKIKDSNKEILDLSCSICIENFKVNEYYRKLNCNHYFHKRCIDRWIKKDKNECPMCRSLIN